MKPYAFTYRLSLKFEIGSVAPAAKVGPWCEPLNVWQSFFKGTNSGMRCLAGVHAGESC